MVTGENQYDILELLAYINPATLDYQEWVNVGMALKDAGYSAADWDRWSMADSRYKRGECFRKWETFRGAAVPVTAGTIVQMARDNGWQPERPDYEIGWNDYIGGKDDLVVVNTSWVEGKEIVEPKEWNPVVDLIRYL